MNEKFNDKNEANNLDKVSVPEYTETAPADYVLEEGNNIASLKSQIEDINKQVQGSVMRGDEADKAVAELEYQIHAQERINRGELTDEQKLVNLKAELDDINRAVQSSEMKLTDAEEKTTALEKEIYDIEKPSEDSGSEKKEGEVENEDQPILERKEADPIRTEYLNLKRTFKDSQREFQDELEKSFAKRGPFSKFFGLGRNSMDQDALQAHGRFMDANIAYHKFAKENGIYDKINDRINRDKPDGAESSVALGVANRHVFKPAEKRLDIQSNRLPEGLRKVKESIVRLASKNKKTSIAIGLTMAGSSLIFNTAGLATGLAVGGIGKLITKKKESGLKEQEKDTIARFEGQGSGEYLDIDKLEDEYFESLNSIDKTKANTRMAAVGAAIAAGSLEEILESGSVPVSEQPAVDAGQTIIDSHHRAVEGFSTPTYGELAGVDMDESGNIIRTEMDPSIAKEIAAQEAAEAAAKPVIESDPNFSSMLDVYGDTPPSVESSVPEVEPASVVAETVEKIFIPERGDNLSSALLEGIRERVGAGSLQLPKGVSPEGISHYIYQSFPEMTSATDITPRLSPEEWVELGVSSGDPNLIQVGEHINMQGLIDKMWGVPQEVVTQPAPDTSILEGVVGDTQNIGDVPTAESLDVSKGELVWTDENGDLQFREDVYAETASSPVESVPADNIIEGVVGDTENVAPTHPDVDSQMSEPVSSVEDTVVSPESLVVNENINQAKIVSQAEIIEGRQNLDALAALERMQGYQPKVSTEIAGLVVPLDPNEHIIHQVYDEMLSLYRHGDINLPADRMAFIAKNETALYSFIEETARELSDSKISAFFGASHSLGLSAAEWQGLGISSGDPQIITAGDNLQVGRLVQTILERAAEKINKNL